MRRFSHLFSRHITWIALMLTSFCSSRVVAGSFTASGSTLTIDLDVASQLVTVVSTGTTYTFTLSGGATNSWTGTTSTSVSVSGTVLTVTATGLSTFGTINITDSQTGTMVTFATSGANAYSDHFNITLDNTPGAVTFSGSSSFSGSSAINVTTSMYITFTLSSLTTADGNLTLDANMQTPSNDFAFSGIMVNNATVQITGTGILTMRGKGGSSGAANSYLNKGIAVINGGQVIGGATGTTTIEGRGYTGVSGTRQGQGVIVYSASGATTISKISTNGSNLSVSGYGSNTTGQPVSAFPQVNAGVVLGSPSNSATTEGGIISAGGSGTVNVTGYGGTTANPTLMAMTYSYGVYLAGSSTSITSAGGDVTVTGTGGGADTLTDYNYGVNVWGGVITSGTNGDVTVSGTGGPCKGNGVNGNVGVRVDGSTAYIKAGTGTGQTLVTGTGGGLRNSGYNYGVWLTSSAVIGSLGSGDVTVIGNGGNINGTGLSNFGIDIFNNSGVSSNGGNVSVEGTGGGGPTTGSNSGISMSRGGFITAGGTGTVTVIGTGGNINGISGNTNYGIGISSGGGSNAEGFITSSGGDVTVTGYGGGGSSGSPSASSSTTNHGVYLENGGYISAGGTGVVRVTGTGGNTSSGATGGTNTGVYVNAFALKSPSGLYSTQITSSGGNIIINGTGGGNGSGGSNYGVWVKGQVKSTGSGTLSVTGTGGPATGSSNIGVAVDGAPTVNSIVYPATITTEGGNITVTGTGGGSGTSSSNVGVLLSLGGKIAPAGSGTVTVNGNGGTVATGSGQHGVGLTGTGSTITTGGGDLNINATEGNSYLSYAVRLASSATITTATNGGNITIKGNSFNTAASCPLSTQASGSVSFIPMSSNTEVWFTSLTDEKGKIYFNTADLATITAGDINIGNANTGLITISQAVTPPTGSNLTLAGSGLSPKLNGIEVSMASGKTLGISGVTSVNIAIAGLTVNTQYDQLKVTADLTLTGRTLTLSGAYTPVAGDVFTIVEATSITGTFTGLANGATVSFNGVNLTINYTATTVTLSAPCTNPTSSGTIAAAQSGSSPFDPVAFTSSAAASGHMGTLEYQWQSSTTSSSASFSNISGATLETYDPGALTQTTWYKRLARVTCKSDWTGAAESNVIEVTVASMASEPTAQSTALYFTTTGSGPYNFVGNFTASGSATGYLVVRATGSAPSFTPTDGNAYTPGSQTGGEIVYSGALTSFTESSVTNDLGYFYAIYAFNGSGSTTNYLTTSPLAGVALARSSSSNTGTLVSSSSASTLSFPSAGATVNFPAGTSGTNLTVTKTASAPSSNIQVSSSIRGMKPLYFSITSSTASPGTYTLILDFSALSLTPTQWNSYKITKRANASSPWVDVTTLGATIVNRQTDGVLGKFTITGLSSFSEFGLAEVYDGVLVSNLDQPTAALPATVSQDDHAGQAFITDGIRYNLSKVKVAVDAGNATKLRVKLYGANASDGSVNSTSPWPVSFGTPTQIGTTSVYEFTPTSTVKLEPNTQYWVMFYTSDATTVDLEVSMNTIETGPASYPANLSGSSNDGGATFNAPDGLDPIVFSVEATEVTRTWTGGSSTVWSASGNWSPSETPGNGEIMTIPNVSNDPVLDANIAPANLIVASGTVLNMADKNITLTQGFSNDGSLTSTTGKVILAGTSAQGIVGTGSISRLEVNNSAGAVISAGAANMQTITGMLTPTSGTLTTNGNLTLKSDATGTARVGAGSASGGYITGDVITQRHLTRLIGGSRNGRAWRLVSVPVEGTGTLRDYFMAGRSGADLTISANRLAEPDALGTVVIGHNQPDAATATGAGYDWIGVAGQVSSLRYYTQSSGSGSFASAQVPSLSTTYTAAAQGYMLFSRGDRQQQYNGTGNSSTTKLQATGTLKQGTKTVTIPALATAGYVLVGNPYMAVIDMDLVYNDNSSIIDPVFYIWDANTDGNSFKQGGYRTVSRNPSTGIWTTTGGGSNPQYIESHAAFFVRPTAAGGTLQIKESHKVTGTPGIAPHGTDGNNPARLFVNLEVTDTANRRLVDGAVVFFDAPYKEGLGDAVDIASMSNITAGAVGLKQSGMRLAMEGRPWPVDSLQRSIPVDMRNLGDDPYVLRLIGESLTKDGFRAWLKDRHLKTETEVKVDGELLYPFRRTGDAGIDSGRFEIVYRTTPKSTGGTVTPDDASETPSVRLFPNPSKTDDVKLSLRAMAPGAYTIQVLDMLGREVATGAISHQTMNGEYRVLKGTRLSPGQYLIRLSMEGKPVQTLTLIQE